MKGGTHQSMPPELRDALELKAPEARRKIERVWGLLGRLEDENLEALPNEAAWADLEQRLETSPSTTARRAPDRAQVRRGKRRAWVGLSMVAGLVVLLLGVWLWRAPVTVVAARGQQITVTLPDGSTAQLNSDSRLRYHSGFRAWPFVPARARRVTLEGEAFFEVVRATRPFVVETFNTRVDVLGTEFNVRARQGPGEGETRVTLASGRVRVTAQSDLAYTMLLSEAGQVARVGAPMPVLSSASVENLDRVLAWRQRGFAVVDQPLGSILAEVERRYALSIDVEEGIALTTSMTVFYPRGATAEKIIHDICLAQGCRYRPTSQGVALFPADSSLAR